jgi:hypothetical protein
MRALKRLLVALEQPRIRQLLDEAEKKAGAWEDQESIRALRELDNARRAAKTAPLPPPPKEEWDEYQQMLVVEWSRKGMNKSAAKAYMEIWAETESIRMELKNELDELLRPK